MTLPDLSARLRDLRAERDEARRAVLAEAYSTVESLSPVTLDTLLSLHAQVTTLENAEKLEEATLSVEGHPMTKVQAFPLAGAFLRATVEGA